MSDPDEQQQWRTRAAEAFNRAIPHNLALGAHIVEAGEARAVARMGYRAEFLGDAVAGVWHTGPAIALADATSGLAVLLALPGPESFATLDLRMDYLRPAVAEAPLYARGVCHHLTRRIAFTRATLDQGDPDRPTAICTATFMRTSRDNQGKA